MKFIDKILKFFKLKNLNLISYSYKFQDGCNYSTSRTMSCDEWTVCCTQINHEYLKKISNTKFIPYIFYDKNRDVMSAYFKDDFYVVNPVGGNIELHISMNGEIVGLNILKVKDVLQNGY